MDIDIETYLYMYIQSIYTQYMSIHVIIHVNIEFFTTPAEANCNWQ